MKDVKSAGPKSLYRELTMALVLLVTLVSFMVSLLNYFYASRESGAQFDSKVAAYTANLNESLEWPLWNMDDELIAKIGMAFTGNTEISSLLIFDDRQRIVYSHGKPGGNQIGRSFIIEHEGKKIGSVEIGLSMEAYEEKSRWLLYTSISTALLMIVSLLAAMRWILARLLKKPVDTLVGIIEEVVERKYQRIEAAQTYVEFSPIVSGIKIMSDTVAAREASLRASEQKLLSILEGVDACIYLKDLDGRYLFANRPVRELWQVEMEDIIGFGDEKFFDAATAANIRQNDLQVLSSGKVVRTEEVNSVTATGMTVFYQSTKLPLRREDGSIYALCGISVDITERKRMEKLLREGNQLLNSIVENIPNMVFLKSANDLRFELLNRAGEELLGRARDEFIGKNDYDFFPKEQADFFTGKDKLVLAENTLLDIPEERIETARGARILHTKKLTLRDDQGCAQHLLGISEDITDRKLAEEQLRRYKGHLEDEVTQRTAELVLARNAAEAANLAKSVFLSSMSHELRTPLNAVLGFSGLMRKDSHLTPSQRTNLDIINRSGEHLLTLINDVLEMAKIESGRVQLEHAPLDLGYLVREVTDMMQLRAREKGLQMLIDQSSEFPRYIRGDEARLRQILINLVGNAVKFTQQGGVTVRFGMMPHVSPQRLLIEVEDSGPGINEADQQHIFEPFVQVGEPSAQKGTGLGLTITRQFVQLMGGEISVVSTPGAGSLFRVELPVEMVVPSEVAQREERIKGEIIGMAPGQRKLRILIVEDQLENQLLLANLMENIGLPYAVADNGERAVSLFQSYQPDLIWMDRRMPVMDGLEATRQIRQLPGGKEVRIVAVTASAFTEQRKEMLAAGMDDFVRKPYRFNEIYDCLARQLDLSYVYAAGEEKAPPTLTNLASLPLDLREQLREALESLDSDRISLVVAQVADDQLRSALHSQVENFDYPAILDALDAVQSEK